MVSNYPRLRLEKASLLYKSTQVLKDITFELNPGESLAIIGASGSGKTSLAKLISKSVHPTSGIVENNFRTVFVPQQDHFSEIAGLASTYYSKRYEFHDYENPMTVPEFLQQLLKRLAIEQQSLEDLELLDTFKVRYLLDRNLMQLSNGERKRLQLIVAILEQPELLIVDQPFTGLDVGARAQLSDLLKQLIKQGLSLVIICGKKEVPDFIDKVFLLKEGQIALEGNPQQVKVKSPGETAINTTIEVDELLGQQTDRFDTIISMNHVNVQMKGSPILIDINWQVKQGECWALLGHNGAGKSTLLSMVTADNPQGYTNDLKLFDRQRGSGESIWDIKSRIGYLSPELHLYFMRGKGVLSSVPGITSDAKPYSTLSCLDVIISGYLDEIGTVSPPTPHQRATALSWLEMVKLTKLQNTLFLDASLGEQRVILLLRALIKAPALLILDEPCQGMDADQIEYFKGLLDHICSSKHITMVYVSHHKDEIPSSVQNVLVLEKGKVIENGPIRTL